MYTGIRHLFCFRQYARYRRCTTVLSLVRPCSFIMTNFLFYPNAIAKSSRPLEMVPCSPTLPLSSGFLPHSILYFPTRSSLPWSRTSALIFYLWIRIHSLELTLMLSLWPRCCHGNPPWLWLAFTPVWVTAWSAPASKEWRRPQGWMPLGLQRREFDSSYL